MSPLQYDRVVIYAHHAPPQPSASATRMLSLARHLRDQGVTVDFLTTKPGPESHDGFHIRRARGRVGLWNELRRHPRCPIIVSSPPSTPAAEVAFIARFLGYRVVVDIRDPFVSEALKNGDLAPGPKTWAKLALEWSLFRSAHVVSYVSDPLRKLMDARFGAPRCPQILAPNGIDRGIFYLDDTPPSERRRALELGEGAIFVYVGILGGKSLDQAFAALAPALHAGAKLLMIAVLDEYSRPLQQALEAQAEKLGMADQVIWRFNLSPEEVAKHLSACDIGLNPLPFNRSYCLPVKTFEFLACGVHPLNIIGKDSALRDILDGGDTSTFCFSWDECSRRALDMIDDLPRLRAGQAERARTATQYDRSQANSVLTDALLNRTPS